MFRLWEKNLKTTGCSGIRRSVMTAMMTRTAQSISCTEEVCYVFDLGKPIWLEHNIDEFKRHAKARFYQDSFIEQIDFDFLEIQVIDED